MVDKEGKRVGSSQGIGLRREGIADGSRLALPPPIGYCPRIAFLLAPPPLVFSAMWRGEQPVVGICLNHRELDFLIEIEAAHIKWMASLTESLICL